MELILIHLAAWSAQGIRLPVGTAQDLVLADVVSSFKALAGQFAGYLEAVFSLATVFFGYSLIAASLSEDVQGASRAKRAFGMALLGAVLVGTALTFATATTGNIK
jgi:FtsH-binding integral membrane protein